MSGGSYAYVFLTVIIHHKGHLHLSPRDSSKQIMVKKKYVTKIKNKTLQQDWSGCPHILNPFEVVSTRKETTRELVKSPHRTNEERSDDEERWRGSPPRLQRLLNNACLFKDNERECICPFFFNLNETSEASRPACLLVYIIIKGVFVVSQLR